MNVKMLFRILDKRAVIIYFITISLLSLINTKDVSVIGILGGINTSKSIGALDVFGVIKWNICVLPPVAVSTLFMISEMGPISKYTMSRSESVKNWAATRFISIIVANIFYLLAALIITSIFNFKIDVSSNLFYRLMVIFPLHTIMLSMLSIMLLAIYKTPKSVIITYLIVEGITAVIGCVLPSTSKFMLAYWGMAYNNNLLLSNSYFHFSIVISFMLMLTVLSIYITTKFFITNNPAANIINL